jgi:uncharacterized protein (TIGR02996 family)
MPPRKTPDYPSLPTELLALLAACKEEPDEDTPRLVLADWLEDHGQPHRAELVRVQVELARLPEGTPRHQELSAREGELLFCHGEEWVGPLHKAASFRRGLLRYSAPRGQLLNPRLSRPSAAAPWAWVEELWLGGITPEDAEEIAVCPLLNSVTILDTSFHTGESSDALVAVLEHSPHLAGLRKLRVNQCDLGPEETEQLARSPCVRNLVDLEMNRNYLCDRGAENLARWWGPPHRLRSFDLQTNGIGDKGATVLAGWPGLAELTYFALNYNAIAADGLAALAGSPHLGNLRQLHLERNPLGPTAGQVLARRARWARLERLGLGSCGLGDDGVAGLAAAEWLASVTDLHLLGNAIGDTGARALARAPYLANLTRLVLYENQIGSEGVRALAQSPHLTKLTELNLGNNVVDAAGTAALASSTALGGLSRLSLAENPIGDAGALALAGATGLSGLTYLHVANCGLTDAGALALANSTALANLVELDLASGWADHPARNRFSKATKELLRKRTDKKVIVGR